MKLIVHMLAMIALAASGALGDVRFEVKFDPPGSPGTSGAASHAPVSGRLIVSIIREGSKVAVNAPPNDAPFWDDPQPMFGMDVAGLAPGASVTIDSTSGVFPPPIVDVQLSLSPRLLWSGDYWVQARLITNREPSNWRFAEGNWESEVVRVRVGDDTISLVHLSLTSETHAPAWKPPREAQEFSVTSKLLSAFRGREVMLRALVVRPAEFDAKKKYPAIYFVPGFGGDHRDMGWATELRSAPADSPKGKLARSAFIVVLNPDSPNGHTLFADSANNGPCGQALVSELIPALEREFPLIAKPEARVLRGHSSGGWSTLWLALTYPETFGASWPSSPDPVDFRRFQLVDIYAQHDMYGPTPREDQDAAFARFQRGDATVRGMTGHPPADYALFGSFRADGKVRMTIRQENLMEGVQGARNTSGQQWDSWQAVFGPRAADGHVADLFDPVTGAIDHAVAERYRKYDIADRIRHDPKLARLVRERVRLVVGGEDSFYLNEAVELLRDDLENVSHLLKGDAGYIKVVPGKDHGTIFQTPEMEDIPRQMLDYLVGAGVLR